MQLYMKWLHAYCADFSNCSFRKGFRPTVAERIEARIPERLIVVFVTDINKVPVTSQYNVKHQR